MTIVVDFDGKSVPLQIEESQYKHDSIVGNAAFPTPLPTMIAYQAGIDALQAAYLNAFDGGKVLKALMRLRRNELKLLTIQLASYVQSVSGGDEAILLSSGFRLRKSKTPAVILNAPEALTAKPATHENELTVVCQPVKGATSYIWQWSLDSDPFTVIGVGGISTKAKFKVTGLTSGTKYWFRVSAVNSAGMSGWSELAFARPL